MFKRINWSNPITKGLVAVYSAPERRELVTNAPAVQVPSSIAGKLGRCHESISGLIEHVEFPHNPRFNILGVNYTMLVILERVSTEGANPGILAIRSAFSDGLWEMWSPNNTTIQVRVRRASSSSDAQFTGMPLMDNNLEKFAFRSEGTAAQSLFFRIGGVAQTSVKTTTNNMSIQNANDHGLIVGGLGLDVSTNDHVFGKYYTALIWDRDLITEEINAIFDDKDIIFIQEQIIIPVYVPLIIIAPPVCDEILAPDVLQTQTNLTGSVADINELVDTPDANWLVSP